MSESKNKILVVGIGNEILTDDGIGPKICDFIKEKFSNGFVDFEKLNVGGLEVLEFIAGYETVVFIDAIKTKNGKVGNVSLITPESFKETLHLSNFHDTSFITALELGKSLGFKVPSKLYIIAVEIKEDRIFSEEFTTELSEKFEEVQQNVMDYLIWLLPEHFNSKTIKQGEYIQ